MRLFQLQDGFFHLRQFNQPANRPAYAILSHRWREEEEVLFEEVKHLSSLPSARGGVQKIRNCEALIKSEDGIDAFWIDTCCINKDSSAELQEAINSMYRWYRDAEICYAYLDDVDICPDAPSETESRIRASEWFTRCWTLQELIAAQKVVFYDRTWQRIGTRDNMTDLISSITGIPTGLLLGKAVLSDFSVAQRMSWAAHRQASRVEDESYSLLGLFGISLPMLYGEGDRAFLRLQEEIIRSSADQSILSWRYVDDALPASRANTVLARSIRNFAACSDVVPTTGSNLMPFRLTNVGVEISLQVFELKERSSSGMSVDETSKARDRWGPFALLQCRSIRDPTQAFTLPLQEKEITPGMNQENYSVRNYGERSRVKRLSFGELPRHRPLKPVVLRWLHLDLSETIWIRLYGHGLTLSNAYPSDAWIHEPRPMEERWRARSPPCVDVQMNIEKVGSDKELSGALELQHKAETFVLNILRDRYSDYIALEQDLGFRRNLESAHREFTKIARSWWFRFRRGEKDSNSFHYLTSALTGRHLLISSNRGDSLRKQIAYEIYASEPRWPRVNGFLLWIIRRVDLDSTLYAPVPWLGWLTIVYPSIRPLSRALSIIMVDTPSYLLLFDSTVFLVGDIIFGLLSPTVMIVTMWRAPLEEYLLGRPLNLEWLSSSIVRPISLLGRILYRIIAMLLWLGGHRGTYLQSLLLAGPTEYTSSTQGTRKFHVVKMKHSGTG